MKETEFEKIVLSILFIFFCIFKIFFKHFDYVFNRYLVSFFIILDVVDKIYQVKKNNLFYLILLHITISFLLFSFCLFDFTIKFKILKMEEKLIKYIY